MTHTDGVVRPKRALQSEPVWSEETFLAIARAYDALSAEAQRFFEPQGITSQQFNVLRILYVRDEDGAGVPCSLVAERMLNRVPDITRLLDRLERAELVERQRCGTDRRVVRARLTERGHALVEELHQPLLALHERLASSLDESEQKTLVSLLQRLTRQS